MTDPALPDTAQRIAAADWNAPSTVMMAVTPVLWCTVALTKAVVVVQVVVFAP